MGKEGGGGEQKSLLTLFASAKNRPTSYTHKQTFIFCKLLICRGVHPPVKKSTYRYIRSPILFFKIFSFQSKTFLSINSILSKTALKDANYPLCINTYYRVLQVFEIAPGMAQIAA